MKTLVTHINPHLDDIFAIWLYKKYVPNFAEASLDFISASREAATQSQDRIFIGTGGGEFDEHKEGLSTCAGSLVFDYLKSEGLLPEDEMEVKALEELVEWNKLIDLGKMEVKEWEEFEVASFIRPLDAKLESSEAAVKLGGEILDRILEVLKNKQQSLKDWEKRVGFETKFGKSCAVISETIDRPFCKRAGGDLFLIYNPKYHAVQFFTPSHELDLSPIYEKVKSLDPDADWFLHQSHHMVLCGSSAAPDAKPTKLSFEQLMKVAKSI